MNVPFSNTNPISFYNQAIHHEITHEYCRIRCRQRYAVTCWKDSFLHPPATLLDIPYMGRSEVHTNQIFNWGKGETDPELHPSFQLPAKPTQTELVSTKVVQYFFFASEFVV
jgi:hypothetical protein